MRKGILAYNPSSGDQRMTSRLDAILSRFQDQGILLQPYRLRMNDLSGFRDLLLEQPPDMLLVAGGDGTINQMVNLLRKTRLLLPLGVIPTGTCNDFARSLSLPSTIEGCLDVILAGKTMWVDVGVVNKDTAFVATCAGGMFAESAYKTDGDLKKNFGPVAYYLNALNEMVAKKTFNIDLETESSCVRHDEVLMFLVVNGANAGGFTGVMKEADMCDGMMDIILIKNCGPLELADMFFKVLWHDILKNRNVFALRAKTCRISGDAGISMTIDGEPGGKLPVEIQFEHRTLEVFVP